jgi:hypothetical protein
VYPSIFALISAAFVPRSDVMALWADTDDGIFPNDPSSSTELDRPYTDILFGREGNLAGK